MKYTKDDFDTLFIDVSWGRREWIDENSSRRVCPVKRVFEITGFPASMDGRLSAEADRAFGTVLREVEDDVRELILHGIKSKVSEGS